MSTEREVNQIKQDRPQSESRRRFLKNTLIIASRAAGLTIGTVAGFDLVVNRPLAVADIVLDAKEKSPNATKEEIKAEKFDELVLEGEKSATDGLGVYGGLKIATHRFELEFKEKRNNDFQSQSPVVKQPEPQK